MVLLPRSPTSGPSPSSISQLGSPPSGHRCRALWGRACARRLTHWRRTVLVFPLHGNWICYESVLPIEFSWRSHPVPHLPTKSIELKVSASVQWRRDGASYYLVWWWHQKGNPVPTCQQSSPPTPSPCTDSDTCNNVLPVHYLIM